MTRLLLVAGLLLALVGAGVARQDAWIITRAPGWA